MKEFPLKLVLGGRDRFGVSFERLEERRFESAPNPWIAQPVRQYALFHIGLYIHMTNEIAWNNIFLSPSFLGIIEKVLLSFSVYSNGAKILSANQSAGSLGAVNGIRFLSMSWVILGHTIFFANGYDGRYHIVSRPVITSSWSESLSSESWSNLKWYRNPKREHFMFVLLRIINRVHGFFLAWHIYRHISKVTLNFA